MIVRIALAALVVAAVGVLTGTIDPAKVVDRIPRPGHQDKTAVYLDMVEGDFARLQPLSGQFFNGCDPKPAVAGTCYATAVPMLGALRSFRNDLEGASVPDSFAAAHASLELGVAKGLQGLAEVMQAVRSHGKARWLRARESLRASDALMQRAFEQLPAADRPQTWGY
jgi:hypothetical protein